MKLALEGTGKIINLDSFMDAEMKGDELHVRYTITDTLILEGDAAKFVWGHLMKEATTPIPPDAKVRVMRLVD